MIKRTMSIDFSVKSGKIKPLSAVNFGPRVSLPPYVDLSDEYREMHIPLVRIGGPCHSFLDCDTSNIHTLFPDPSLDEELESSYSFAALDRHLLAVKDVGADVFLKLGESNGSDYLASLSPTKLAKIIEHIIAHYNEGFASGFKLKIKYCELFSDADILWQSEPEKFYSLYCTVANHLKERFPRLKVGGYSSFGFYSLNHPLSSIEEKGRVDFLEGFLAYSRLNKAPIDFFSWKCIADFPEELSLHSNYARSYLSQYGFSGAESIVSEFNLREADGAMAKRSRTYPSALLSSLIIAEKSSISAMFYSDLHPYSPMNSILTIDDGIYKHRYASFEVMRAYGELSGFKSAVYSTEDYRRELYLLASYNKEGAGILLATRDYDGVVELVLKNASFESYSVRGIIGGGDRGAGYVSEQTDIPLSESRITLRTGKNEVYYIRLS